MDDGEKDHGWWEDAFPFKWASDGPSSDADEARVRDRSDPFSKQPNADGWVGVNKV